MVDSIIRIIDLISAKLGIVSSQILTEYEKVIYISGYTWIIFGIFIFFVFSIIAFIIYGIDERKERKI